METSLHRDLKARFGPESGGLQEVRLGGYRIDAIAADGVLVEVQSGRLGPLRGKLGRFLPELRVRVVKPVVVARRVVRREKPDGQDLSTRRSPKRGSLADVFDDLMGVLQVFPHPNLQIEVLGVEVDEVRVGRRRRPGYAVVDRRLREVVSSVVLCQAADLWSLIGEPPAGTFTSRDLAETLGKPLDFARRVAYCLRLTGAAEAVGKAGNAHVYQRRIVAGL